MQAVYTVLREAEYRSTYPLPYWNLPLMRLIVPRQRRCQAGSTDVPDASNDLAQDSLSR